MQVAKSRLVNLFVLLGCPKAEKWSNEVLECRAASICELFDLEMKVEEKYQKFFEKLYIAVQNKEQIIIEDDDLDPVEEHVRRMDTSLRLPPIETPVEQQERLEQSHKKRRDRKTDVPADPSQEELEPEMPKKQRRKEQKPNYGQYLSEWGTWTWMPGYAVDQFFLDGSSGTIPEIMAATNRGRVSVQRHLLLLLRFGLIVWDEGDVFRPATREERIEFMDHGIKEKFRPIGVFVVRKPMIQDEGGEDV